jgi:protein-disulfide isomerase
MKRYLPFLIVAAVALITIGTGWMLFRAKRLPTPTAAPKESNPSREMHVRGEADAPVTLEEFGDFECPPCSIMSGAIHQLEKDYGSKLRVIFRQFPLPTHAHAREAALASEAAHLQGRFWEMHDLLYKEQAVWSKAADVPALFDSYAGTIGLDLERFKKDLQNPEVDARVTADHDEGASRGVGSTPTIFINKTVVPPPSLNPLGLRKTIDAALQEKPTS